MLRRHASVEQDDQCTAAIEAVRHSIFTSEQRAAIEQAEAQLTAGNIDAFLAPLHAAIDKKKADAATRARSFFHRHLPKVIDEKSADMSEREKFVADLKLCLTNSHRTPVQRYNQAIRLIEKSIEQQFDYTGRFVYQLQILRDALRRVNSQDVPTELSAAAPAASR